MSIFNYSNTKIHMPSTREYRKSSTIDAMTSVESYKYENIKPAAITERLHSAIGELKNNAGTQFDPKLVEAFIKNIDESYLEGM